MISRSQARGLLFGYLAGSPWRRTPIEQALTLMPRDLAATLVLHRDNRAAIDWRIEREAADKFCEALDLVGVAG